MIKIRKSNERGHFQNDWLNSYHTFSFSDYYDKNFMGFRSLRVINEDWVQPAKGFPTHAHADFEIITYVLEGTLEHKDSMGNGSLIQPGDVQRMSAGTGVTHSEFNHSQTDLVHLLQIWIVPAQKGIVPDYEQKKYSDDDKRGKLCLIASQDGRNDSVTVHQDAEIYATLLGEGQKLDYSLSPGRHVWAHVAKGQVVIQDNKLTAGDAVAVSEEKSVSFLGVQEAEIIIFDLA